MDEEIMDSVNREPITSENVGVNPESKDPSVIMERGRAALRRIKDTIEIAPKEVAASIGCVISAVGSFYIGAEQAFMHMPPSDPRLAIFCIAVGLSEGLLIGSFISADNANIKYKIEKKSLLRR